jgi:hypothetical protein
MLTKKIISKTLALNIEWGMETLYKKVLINVSGAHYGFRSTKTGRQVPIRGAMTNIGKLPVPVVYGDLRDSITKQRLDKHLGAVFAHSGVAPHAKEVHNGSKTMRPRRFLGDAVTGLRPIIIRKFVTDLKAASRLYGRKRL